MARRMIYKTRPIFPKLSDLLEGLHLLFLHATPTQLICISAKVIEHNLALKGNLIHFQGNANEKKSVFLMS